MQREVYYSLVPRDAMPCVWVGNELSIEGRWRVLGEVSFFLSDNGRIISIDIYGSRSDSKSRLKWMVGDVAG